MEEDQSPNRYVQVPAPVVRVSAVGEIKIYQITEDELERLAGGSPDSPALSVALALISTSATLLVTLQTAVLTPNRHEHFVAAFWVTALLGALLSLLWISRFLSSRRLVSKIKSRLLPSPGEQQPTEPISEG